MSLELKEAIWPHHAFVNVFFSITPPGPRQTDLCVWNKTSDFHPFHPDAAVTFI